MWNLDKSFILLVFIGTVIVNGSDAPTISYSKLLEEDLSLKFGEPMDKCNNTKEEYIKFVNTNLDWIRSNFVISDHVKSVNLENNKIVEVSLNAFKDASKLSCLNIGSNNIIDLFDSFLPSFNHASLNKLNLVNASFKGTLEEYYKTYYSDSKENIEYSKNGNLTNVTHLDISWNRLKEIPNCLNTSFPSLTHLYMSNNDLHSDTFNRIPATTQHLYIEKNSEVVVLSNFPRNITGIFLHEVIVEWDIFYLLQYPNLTTFSCSKCLNVANYFYSLDTRKLVNVDISSNNIKYLREDLFRSAKSLKRLSVDRNNLDSLLFLTPLSALTDLSMAYNNLEKLPNFGLENLKNLRTLNLRGNYINEIQKYAFSDLKMLEKLDLAENNLSNIPTSWMRPLSSLYYLNFKWNEFPTLFSMYIPFDSKLSKLFAGNNLFSNIDFRGLLSIPLNATIFMSR
ncbi:hypothetical protein M0802_002793 [Mischocyttarus mexicanus]|nr:hypothetical protein M0802_002793 [Mischocyttarus mexicanus]